MMCPSCVREEHECDNQDCECVLRGCWQRRESEAPLADH